MKPLVSNRIWFFLFIGCAWLLSLMGVIHLTADEMKGVCDVEIEDRDAEIATLKLKQDDAPKDDAPTAEPASGDALAACLSGLDACVADARQMAAYVMLCECNLEHASYEEGKD